jgi:hypothetical protein
MYNERVRGKEKLTSEFLNQIEPNADSNILREREREYSGISATSCNSILVSLSMELKDCLFKLNTLSLNLSLFSLFLIHFFS